MIVSLAALAGRLRAAWNPHRSDSLNAQAVRELIASLKAEKTALKDFTVAMEQEFLELGGQLRMITSMARQVRDRSEEVIAAASGRAEDAAIQFAFQLLKKAEDLVQANREQHEDVFSVFERMHVDLTGISKERATLLRTLSPLETTNVQFRIQACAFDEDTRVQFFALADVIGGIVKDVQTAVGQRFEELERAGRAAGELVSKLTAITRIQKRKTEEMLAESRTHLSMLNEVLQSSDSVAHSLSHTGVKIAAGVGKTIVALQCQDMARQKFQHINGAIDEIVRHLEGRLRGDANAETESDCRRFLGDASAVQLAQLQAVFDQLGEAANQVREGLYEVDEESKCLAEYAMRSGDATLDGQIIERAIGSIRAILSVIDHAVENVRSVAELVFKLKAAFSDCTSQILGLALRLRMVALNAQIFASRVDVQAGSALEVVASNTRMISDEAMQQLDQVSSQVTRLVDTVVDLEQRLGDHHELAGVERNQLVGEARESEEKLMALEKQLRSSIAAIGVLEREFAGATRRAVECIRFPDAVRRASARSTAFFQKIAERYSDSRGGFNGRTHYRLEELKSNYTMAHERDVHDGVLEHCRTEAQSETPAKACEPPLLKGSNEVKDDELADNIELF